MKRILLSKKRKIFKSSKKMFILIAACLGMASAGFGAYSSQASGLKNTLQYDTISSEEAVQIALVYTDMDRESAKETGDDTFKSDITVSNVRTMYDFSDEISSYLVEFADSYGEPSGYVVVGANDCYAPIVEYSYDGYMFLYDALEDVKEDTDVLDDDTKLKDVVLYYPGMIDYYIADEHLGDENIIYNVSGDICEEEKSDTLTSIDYSDEEIDKIREDYEDGWSQFNKEYKNNKKKLKKELKYLDDKVFSEDNEFFDLDEYKEKKFDSSENTNMSFYSKKSDSLTDTKLENNSAFIKNTVSSNNGCSLPRGTYFPEITNPGDYESGYIQAETKYVQHYWTTYVTYRNFSGTPSNVKMIGVAACNLIHYWYTRSYSEIKTKAWTTIYNDFSSISGSSNNTMNINTFASKISSYFSSQLSSIGGGATVKATSDVSLSKIKTEIDNNNPPILILRNHKYYSNNACLCLGYKTYYYQKYFIISTDKTSNYLMIADSRTSSVRYIHYALGFNTGGCIDMIKVDPYPNR